MYRNGEKTSTQKGVILNKDGSPSLDFIRRLSVTFTTICLMTLDKTCKRKYLRQTEESDW